MIEYIEQFDKSLKLRYNTSMASNYLNIIRYNIIESYLGKQMKYRGQIYHPEKVNNQDLVDEIVESNTTITRQDALAVIDLYEDLIKRHLRKGHTVTTGLFRADISLTGSFDNTAEKVDPKRHKAKVVIRPAIKLSERICRGLRFHKRKRARTTATINRFFEMGDPKKEEARVTAGRVLVIQGKGLKSYNHDNSYTLQLVSPKGDVEVDLDVMTTSYGTMTALVPGHVKPGGYFVRLIHEYGSVKRYLPEIFLTVTNNRSL